MNFPDEANRDVFIIYTKGDPYESKFVEALKEQLYWWGLTAWVYEDWEWQTKGEQGSNWRSTGSIDQLDPIRYTVRHPEPFKHRPKGPEPDRDALARIFDQSGAIVMVAPRAISFSPGTFIELEVLRRASHAAVTGVSWSRENDDLLEEIGVIFDYRMPAISPRDFKVASESVARLAWLTCVMDRLTECGIVGRNLFVQLARHDALLNRIARLSPGSRTQIPLEPADEWDVILSDEATPETCAPVLEFWLGGPALTAQWLTSGKPPGEIIEATRTIKDVLRTWCVKAKERFPALDAPSAKIGLAAGAAKMRLAALGDRGVHWEDAIEEFSAALEAPDAAAFRTSILTNRGLTYAEAGNSRSAIHDYTQALNDAGLQAGARSHILHNRAIVRTRSGNYREAERDLDEALSPKQLPALSEAAILISRALVRYRTGRIEDAIADYGRVIDLENAPAEARVKALLNRGALYAKLQRHVEAIRAYGEVIAMRETSLRQYSLALFNRAHSRVELGDATGALEDYETALEQPELDQEMREEIGRRMATIKGEATSA